MGARRGNQPCLIYYLLLFCRMHLYALECVLCDHSAQFAPFGSPFTAEIFPAAMNITKAPVSRYFTILLHRFPLPHLKGRGERGYDSFVTICAKEQSLLWHTHYKLSKNIATYCIGQKYWVKESLKKMGGERSRQLATFLMLKMLWNNKTLIYEIFLILCRGKEFKV